MLMLTIVQKTMFKIREYKVGVDYFYTIKWKQNVEKYVTC